MKTDLFQACSHCWAFQICWHIECSIFIPSSFRTWNSSAWIPSPPLTLALPFFGIGMKTDLFQSYGHCWVFQICWRIGFSIFTASSFRIWNTSTGIPSPPLAFFIVMLSKAHLTSHSRISGCSSWSHHRDYLGHEDLFCTVLLYILVTSSWYILLLLCPYHLCPLSSASLHEIFPWYL